MSTQTIQLPYTLIKVSGPDAERFLQGQLSCDLSELNEGTWTYGTANTPKGRMYWLFIISRLKNDFWIRVHNNIAEQGLSTLSKYKVFFKCDMQVLEDLSVYGTFANEQEQTSNRVIQQSNADTLIRHIDDASGRQEYWSQTLTTMADSESDLLTRWEIDDCMAGIPEIYPETVDKFILQQLNMQELGAVSFKKGCYTGQEIIARMKFLGKLKKRMYLLEAEENISGTPGTSILNKESKKVGELVRLHSSGNRSVGLAVCDIASIENDSAVLLDEAGSEQLEASPLHYNT